MASAKGMTSPTTSVNSKSYSMKVLQRDPNYVVNKAKYLNNEIRVKKQNGNKPFLLSKNSSNQLQRARPDYYGYF